MKHGLLAAFLILAAHFSDPQKEPQASRAENPSPSRWESEIRAFEEWDKKNSFPRDAVLFVGGSSIRLWPTRESFSQFPVINRGFGGAMIADVITYADRIVIPYRPSVICFFAGGNDIAAGRTPQQVIEDAAGFIKYVRPKLPATPILFLSIKPSPKHMPYWPQIKEANTLLEEMCSRGERLYFVDVAAPLLDLQEKPIPSLYQADQQHLNETGYRIWTLLVTPTLSECMRRTHAGHFEEADFAPQADSSNTVSAGYVASKGSKIFHTSTCSAVKRITEANMVRFESREQALRTGRQPCKICKP
ncbi:MAG: hypothetical protein JW828_11595 [Sedimentisphaerales bacterium]|nr:hypothetical protein [Sedimentisphaerales bacterium]